MRLLHRELARVTNLSAVRDLNMSNMNSAIQEEALPHLQDNSRDSDQEENWSDWEADEAENEDVKCLFCDNVFKTAQKTLSHCAESHFDVLVVKRRLGKRLC